MRISWTKEETATKTEWAQGICSIGEVYGPDHVLKVTVVGKAAEWAEKVNQIINFTQVKKPGGKLWICLIPVTINLIAFSASSKKAK